MDTTSKGDGKRALKQLPSALRHFQMIRPLDRSRRGSIERFKIGERVFPAGATIIEEGTPHSYLYTPISGWGMRFKTLPDGRRQILNFIMPGDFVGLQTSVFGEAEHSVEALTEMVVCALDRKKLWDIQREDPQLGYDLIWIAANEERMLDMVIAGIGQLTAQERTAHVLLHLYGQARARGLEEDGRVFLPLTQQHLADAMGMSLVHTNKSLRRLHDMGLISWKGGELKLLNPTRLRELAHIDAEEAD